jgi:hypothetical protein
MLSLKPISAGVLATTLLLCGATAAPEDSTITPNGFGALKFGMPSEQIEHLIQYDKPYRLGTSDACQEFTMPQFAPLGLSFTMEEQKLIRLDVAFGATHIERSAKTDTGIGLGSPEADVLAAYPGAKVKANPADPSWHTITTLTPDKSRGIAFETNGKTVKAIRAGFATVISTATACN